MAEHGSQSWAATAEPWVTRARAFVQQEFPQADAAFLGGSTAAGEATQSSDLDILIVLPEQWSPAAFVETTRFAGQLVEAFVYGPASLEVWLEKGRDDHRPVLDRLIAEGLPLTDNALTHDLGVRSREVLSAGPAVADPADLQRRAYSLSSLVDDLADRPPGSRADTTGVPDAAETTVLAWTAWKEAAELALVTDRQWLGTGKWLVRGLLSQGDRHGLVAWAAAGHRDPHALVVLAREVLESAGGSLREGYLRGYRPPDL